ncbi:hypothetical protein TWF173_008667 [Orbilia oligospora]|nr:hypothetical protein TWF173_008667 [Orbilia oligospora]
MVSKATVQFDTLLKEAASTACSAFLNAKMATEKRAREDVFRDAFVEYINAGGNQSVRAVATTYAEEADTGADVIITLPNKSELRGGDVVTVYLQIKRLYIDYRSYCSAINSYRDKKGQQNETKWVARVTDYTSTIDSKDKADFEKWKMASPFFNATYQSKQLGQHQGKFQVVRMAEKVEEINVKWQTKEKPAPVATGGFLLIPSPWRLETDPTSKEDVWTKEQNTDVKVVSLDNCAEVSWLLDSAWKDLNGSKLNKILESSEGIAEVCRWGNELKESKYKDI